VSFFNGAGSDALISASSLLAAHAELPVYVALYLLPLRHPVLVARQLATIAQLAPGRLTLGVGIGGENPHEVEICGVEPRTRGRRMDECLRILRCLGEGTPVTFSGEFFTIEDALIAPAQLCDQIGWRAAEAGRDGIGFEHALNVWCGFAASRAAARDLVATQMQAFYQLPFEPFERYSPYGTPEDVAEFLSPYIEAGCSNLNIIPCARDDEDAFAAMAELRSLIVH
jgi:alkanesulfonate monooxygenase SsuD/methylene tetrahydromethanopterin reductase-like flavin-dependent oxidoreductase (luciferase family)